MPLKPGTDPVSEPSESAVLPSFERGESAGLNPEHGEAFRTGGEAVTHLRSPWLHRRCPHSYHTFRIGDSVWVEPDGSVRHSDEFLRKLQAEDSGGAGDPSTTEIAAFFSGLDLSWPPPPDLPVIRLPPGHPLLAPPLGRLARKSCAVCGHTFRVNDHVVVCPCHHLLDFPPCQIAIHRDPVHGLHCYEAWNPGSGSEAAGLSYCPVSSAELRSPPGRRG